MPSHLSHLSHLSPPLGTRKPRAATPRTTLDYNLLAATVACWGIPVDMISRHFGFESDYAERLLRSTAGQTFTNWLWQQPEEFIKHFRVNINNEPSSDETRETSQLPDHQRESPTASAEEALAKFYSDSTKDQ